ncbi:MAG: ankyrin repeat domain-containing protein [Wolbachia endosymbiont of Penenirmus auritus]|nr:ankyrin repeat domain-containing protein [Wolbachia endosymbiont of Penenirmus auritus]
MIYQEWKKVLNAENSDNIIKKIKDKLRAEDPNIYKEWEEVKFDVNHQFQDIKNTLLHVATGNGNVDVVNTLLEIKGIDVNAKNSYGYTPLHFAVKVGYTEVVNALLETKKIKVNVQDVIRGDTPLHLAAGKGYEGIVKALLAKEASVDIKNDNGMTPLDLTTNKEIKALLQRQNTNNRDGSRDEGKEDSTVEPHRVKIGSR